MYVLAVDNPSNRITLLLCIFAESMLGSFAANVQSAIFRDILIIINLSIQEKVNSLVHVMDSLLLFVYIQIFIL